METITKYRINSIDILRGLVMIIMALDHTRDFFHKTAMTDDPLNLATTTLPLYFTRWITHFCAPTFVLLSGISAYLSSLNKTPQQAGIFLIKRGLWLVFVEIVLITFALTFNPIYRFVILQVIWAIGCSMILLGLFIRFGTLTILVSGLILFIFHDYLIYLSLPQSGWISILLRFLFTAQGTVISISSNHFIGIFYAVLPWTAILFLGFSLGSWFSKDYDAKKRKLRLLYSGLFLLILFILLRYFNIYGNPLPWDKQHFLSFIKTEKYPPSLLYSCMTLGPALIALSLLENVKNKCVSLIMVYGRVPFFYYVLHFYLLHILLVIIFYATGNGVAQIIDPTVPFLFRPSTFGFRLMIVYFIWISVVFMLYLPCRWFYKYKMSHSQWWLKYL